MAYNFQRYVDYMTSNGMDAVIASHPSATARMLNYYFKDNLWMAVGLREFNPFVGCDARGEPISASQWSLEQGVEELARVLKSRGLEHGVIGLEMLDFPARALRMLEVSLPLATFVDASWVIHQDMACKTEREIRFIERAVLACEAGFQQAVESMRDFVGRTEQELMWHAFAPEVSRHQVDFLGSNITGMAWEWEEANRAPVIAEGGTPINFDLLCACEGLLCDIAFRAVVGEPDTAFVEQFDRSVLAFDALVKCMKPGMTAGELEERSLEAMKTAAGVWEGYWAIHNAGFRVHEFPQVGCSYLGQYQDYVFEVGNVVSVETIAEQSFVLREDGLHRLGEIPMKIYRA